MVHHGRSLRWFTAMVFFLGAVATALGRTTASDVYGDVTITTFTHSDIQLEFAGKVIRIDPWSVSDQARAKHADLILITDDVAHHLDVKAIARVRKPGAPVIVAANGKAQVVDAMVMAIVDGHRRGLPISDLITLPGHDGQMYRP